MGQVKRIGLDTSKWVFQVHGVDVAERVAVRRKLSREQVLRFFGELEPSLVGLEACGGSHHWARELQQLGHDVRLLPAQYVKPYVKRGKSDAKDAEAICEAVSRPTMQFVPVKSREEQAALMQLRVRELLIKQRTMLSNAIRGHAAEYGVTAAKGMAHLPVLLERARTEVPEAAFGLLLVLAEQLAALDRDIRTLERQVVVWARAEPLCRRLMQVPSVGVLTAATTVLTAPRPELFRSGRQFAAWIGLTPREDSTAGKANPGRISRAGDEELRRLLMAGAMSMVKLAKRGRGPAWLVALVARKPAKVAAIAFANKTARILWAMMRRDEDYRGPLAA
jgi:transposase